VKKSLTDASQSPLIGAFLLTRMIISKISLAGGLNPL